MKIVAFTDVRAWRAESSPDTGYVLILVFCLSFAAVLTALHDASNIY